MANKRTLTPISLALSAAFTTALIGGNMANATENPFAMNQLSSGYMVAGSHMEGKCGEGKCGEH